MRQRRFSVLAAALCLTAFAVFLSEAGTAATLKNIILFIGDGMHLEQERAASRYLCGNDDGLVWHQFPYKAYVTTWDVTTYNRYAWSLGMAAYDARSMIPAIGYDISKGGSKPFPDDVGGSDTYFLTKLLRYGSLDPATGAIPATDSASAATAMATGSKTEGGRISWLPDGRPDGSIMTIAELLKERRGASIGIVSTVPFSHATPAAFVSHNVSREHYYTGRGGYAGVGIAEEIVTATKPEVVIGGGSHLLNNPSWDPAKGYISKELRDHLLQSEEYIFVERTAGVDGAQALVAAADSAIRQKKKLFGLFGGSDGNFEPPVAVDRPGSPLIQRGAVENPSLADATRAALRVLSANEKGFFALVEQGDIDWADHSNNYAWMIGSVWDLNEAVKAAIAFVETPGDIVNWDNTLLIVTADHSTGYLRMTGGPSLGAGDLPSQVLINNAWTYPDHEVAYGTTGHSNELVTLHAQGETAGFFTEYEGAWYPGTHTIDNTHIFRVLAMSLPRIRVLPPSVSFDLTNTGSTSAGQHLSVSNSGSSPLIVDSGAVVGTDQAMFSVKPGGSNACPGLNPTLPEGSGCTFTVKFSPASTGPKSATLTITSNDPLTPMLAIPLTGTGTAAAVFNDVPEGAFAEDFINTLHYNGLTVGCGGGNFCPDSPVTRGQMAIFVERGIKGSDFIPQAAVGIFLDASISPVKHWAADWIEQLYRDGVTSGCSSMPLLYCPEAEVTRGQMAIFLTRGLGQEPVAACTGAVFSDVNAETVGDGFCRYVEKFAELGITSGCRADDPATPENERMYCPNDSVTRAQMAVFLIKSFVR